MNHADTEAATHWAHERPDPDPSPMLDETDHQADPAAWRAANGVPEPPDPWGGDAA